MPLCRVQMDRLILELKLPPADAYHKLCHTLEDINAQLRSFGYPHVISPELGNVSVPVAVVTIDHCGQAGVRAALTVL